MFGNARFWGERYNLFSKIADWGGVKREYLFLTGPPPPRNLSHDNTPYCSAFAAKERLINSFSTFCILYKLNTIIGQPAQASTAVLSGCIHHHQHTGPLDSCRFGAAPVKMPPGLGVSSGTSLRYPCIPAAVDPVDGVI